MISGHLRLLQKARGIEEDVSSSPEPANFGESLLNAGVDPAWFLLIVLSFELLDQVIQGGHLLCGAAEDQCQRCLPVWHGDAGGFLLAGSLYDIKELPISLVLPLRLREHYQSLSIATAARFGLFHLGSPSKWV